MALPPSAGMNLVPTLHNKIPQSLQPGCQTLPQPFVACVTGASRGIGAGIARAFAEAGASGLIITARTISSLQETKTASELAAKCKALKVSVLAADASSETSARDIATIIANEHNGQLDVLINNAGIVSTEPSAFSKLADIESEQIRSTMEINYFGRFYTIKNLLPFLLGGPTKAIINITSVASHFAGLGAIGYNISELATNRLTEAAVEQYGGEGLLCYALHPGMVRTTAPPGISKELLDFCLDDVGLCGAFCVWLVSARRDWLNGRYMMANWDVEELEAKRPEIVEADKLKLRMIV